MSMYPIASTTLNSTTSSITFSSIPQTFTHLQLKIFARTNRALNTDYIGVQFNGDTTSSNYRYHTLYANGSAIGSGDGGNNSGIFMQRIAGNSANANVFGSIICEILDYSNTNKNKTTREIGGIDNNGDGEIHLDSGLWISTNAVNSITVNAQGGSSSFVQYSTFQLYGIYTSNATGA